MNRSRKHNSSVQTAIIDFAIEFLLFKARIGGPAFIARVRLLVHREYRLKHVLSQARNLESNDCSNVSVIIN